MTDDYELMPAVELERLRKEIEILKQNPFGAQNSKSAQESIDNLTTAINKLVQVFSSVEEDMINEVETMKTSQEHFQEIKNQNQQIAAGIVQVAEILNNQPQQETRQEEAEEAQTTFSPVEEAPQAPPAQEVTQEEYQEEQEPVQYAPIQQNRQAAPSQQKPPVPAAPQPQSMPTTRVQAPNRPARTQAPSQSYFGTISPELGFQAQQIPQQNQYSQYPEQSIQRYQAPMQQEQGETLPPMPEPITPVVPEMPAFDDPFSQTPQMQSPFDAGFQLPSQTNQTSQGFGQPRINPPDFGAQGDSLGGLGDLQGQPLSQQYPPGTPVAPPKEKKGLFGLFK